jgi:hypothetical protein
VAFGLVVVAMLQHCLGARTALPAVAAPHLPPPLEGRRPL